MNGKQASSSTNLPTATETKQANRIGGNKKNDIWADNIHLVGVHSDPSIGQRL